jgi:hypothetical protein
MNNEKHRQEQINKERQRYTNSVTKEREDTNKEMKSEERER